MVLFPGLQSLDAIGPIEVFAAATRVADQLGRSGPRYRTALVGVTLDPAVTESGIVLQPTQRLGELAAIDTLLLPGGDGVTAAADDPVLVAEVAAAAARSRRVATVCTGTFLAAAAGLVPPGTRVTTHWARADRLARRHPELTVDPDPIFIRTGSLWTSAGVTSGIDLALALVEDDLGAEVAQTVARWLVVFLRRPGGQSQFATAVWAEPSQRPPVRAAVELVHADPSAPLDAAHLARHAGVSERHFLRLFRDELGTTPARYVEGVRIEAARRLLETEDAVIPAVARRCGFGTDETMRRAFTRRLGVSPDQYRRRFRTAGHPDPRTSRVHPDD